MSDNLNQLPNYVRFSEQLTVLALPFSASYLHGSLCGYLSVEAQHEGEAYLRALTINKRGDSVRDAVQALFYLYTVSQQQIIQGNFSLQLLLPDDEQALVIRARAFSEWCAGFTGTLERLGINSQTLDEEETQDALLHLLEFAKLDFDSLKVNEEDEKALMEVSEYARMAVLRLYWDIKTKEAHQRVGKEHSGQVKH